MVALETPAARLGWKAPDFSLIGTDGRRYGLSECRGERGLLVMFICNHCPYVQKQMDRMIALATDLKAIGVGVIAINSNDARSYPEDSFDNMKKIAQEKHFSFPYLYDDAQTVAQSYGAVCTPDFFGFNAALELQYRGRLDESWSGVLKAPKRELLAAMTEVATKGSTSIPQNPSVGCSIKWRQPAA